MPRNVLRSQARQIVHEVLKFMKSEATDGLLFDLRAVQKRTAAATGVSERTVRRIAVVANAPGASLDEVFRTPGKKRTGRKKVTGLSSTNLGIIKRFIHNYHITEKELPTVKQLLKRLKEIGHFHGQASSMRRILSELGFKWKKTDDGRKILIEHASIRQKRIEYIQEISRYREEGRPVVFIDNSFVETAHASENTTKGLKKCKRVTVILAASDKGVIPNTLVTFHSNTRNDDNKHYDKWFRTQLLPNIPKNAVVAVGKAPFFNKSEDASPTSTSKKEVMEAWLLEKGIPFTSTMLKPQLYKLVCSYRFEFRQFKFDSVLSEYDHPVLRFPPKHRDLNPLENAWTLIKSFVDSNSTRSVDVARKLVAKKVVEINSDIGKFCTETESIELEYAQSDLAIDSLTDEVTIHISDKESDDETDEESGSDDEQHEDSSSDDEVEVMEISISPDAIVMSDNETKS